MKPTDEEADSLFEIDQTQLDKAWLDQPRLYLRWARLLADAQKRYEERKAELKLIEAELDFKIRSKPDKYAIAKVSEDAIRFCIIRNLKFQNAQHRLILAESRVNHLKAVVNALEHRKKALEGNVQLWSMSYFSSPRAKGEIPPNKMEELNQSAQRRRTREANEQIRKKHQRRN